MEFRWNDWNIEHIGEHGVLPVEAEWVVCHARTPYPEHCGDGKYAVLGRTAGGRWIQVIFVVDDEDSLFVIHARPLTDREKKRVRRRTR